MAPGVGGRGSRRRRRAHARLADGPRPYRPDRDRLRRVVGTRARRRRGARGGRCERRHAGPPPGRARAGGRSDRRHGRGGRRPRGRRHRAGRSYRSRHVRRTRHHRAQRRRPSAGAGGRDRRRPGPGRRGAPATPCRTARDERATAPAGERPGTDRARQLAGRARADRPSRADERGAPRRRRLHEIARERARAERAHGQLYGEGGPPAEEVAKIPARRLGEPRELGDLVAFLCSKQASYVSGTHIPVDGGLYRGLL